MHDETPGPPKPIEADARASALPVDPPLADVVRKTLLELADWQEVTERIKTRVRTSKLKPPPEPPEIIP